MEITSLLSDVSDKRNQPESDVKVIAFYLPQYHPIRENDEWWGPGFTEWRNVARARPNFVGHYQPHYPADLGYYDLRLPETRQQQADLAHRYGIHGFCYHHYWFSGRRVLERPFNEVLASGSPDFPFCLCWANEDWTRTWIDTDSDVLLAQHYRPEDAEKFICDLIPAFHDRRYITVDQKPLLLVYRVDLIPDIQHIADLWRQICEKEGLKGLYLAAVQFLESMTRGRTISMLPSSSLLTTISTTIRFRAIQSRTQIQIVVAGLPITRRSCGRLSIARFQIMCYSAEPCRHGTTLRVGKIRVTFLSMLVPQRSDIG